MVRSPPSPKKKGSPKKGRGDDDSRGSVGVSTRSAVSRDLPATETVVAASTEAAGAVSTEEAVVAASTEDVTATSTGEDAGGVVAAEDVDVIDWDDVVSVRSLVCVFYCLL